MSTWSSVSVWSEYVVCEHLCVFLLLWTSVYIRTLWKLDEKKLKCIPMFAPRPRFPFVCQCLLANPSSTAWLNWFTALLHRRLKQITCYHCKSHRGMEYRKHGYVEEVWRLVIDSQMLILVKWMSNQIIVFWFFFTSSKEVMFSPMFISWFVCQQVYTKKVLSGFLQNLDGGWVVAHKRWN